ncbi:MAG: KUP/HAK/KT family potassium transporter, partial [Microvirga sp.]
MATLADAHTDNARAGSAARPVVLGALGVVFGDIGTSPLYALREAATAANHGVLSQATVMGVLSLILWSLIVVISVKYCLFILRA